MQASEALHHHVLKNQAFHEKDLINLIGLMLNSILTNHMSGILVYVQKIVIILGPNKWVYEQFVTSFFLSALPSIGQKSDVN